MTKLLKKINATAKRSDTPRLFELAKIDYSIRGRHLLVSEKRIVHRGKQR
jgi:hypothetical protein